MKDNHIKILNVQLVIYIIMENTKYIILLYIFIFFVIIKMGKKSQKPPEKVGQSNHDINYSKQKPKPKPKIVQSHTQNVHLNNWKIVQLKLMIISYFWLFVLRETEKSII